MRSLLIAITFVAGFLAADASAQEAQRLRIAGLSLGAPAVQLSTDLAKRGFFPVPSPADPIGLRREASKVHRVAVFQRKDGHILRIGVQRENAPIIRTLDYEMGNDVDSYALIRKHLRGLFGKPSIVHGSEASVRLAIWEIPGTDMTVEGLLTTSISLVRDPVEGNSLTVRELRVRPEFIGQSRRISSGAVATE